MKHKLLILMTILIVSCGSKVDEHCSKSQSVQQKVINGEVFQCSPINTTGDIDSPEFYWVKLYPVVKPRYNDYRDIQEVRIIK